MSRRFLRHKRLFHRLGITAPLGHIHNSDSRNANASINHFLHQGKPIPDDTLKALLMTA
jgi:hypothetical protein